MSSSLLIGIVGLLYAGTVVMLAIEGQWMKALIFTGYTIGQIGFYFDTRLP